MPFRPRTPMIPSSSERRLDPYRWDHPSPQTPQDPTDGIRTRLERRSEGGRETGTGLWAGEASGPTARMPAFLCPRPDDYKSKLLTLRIRILLAWIAFLIHTTSFHIMSFPLCLRGCNPEEVWWSCSPNTGLHSHEGRIDQVASAHSSSSDGIAHTRKEQAGRSH